VLGWAAVTSWTRPACSESTSLLGRRGVETTVRGLEGAMSERIQGLLARLRAELEQVYAARLRGVYLYGSYARGEEDAESDVDVIIVLDRVDGYLDEVRRTSALISALSLESGLSISRVLVPEHDWIERDSPFLANARMEAIAA
jgi:Nucleotidyltransferase domain.